MFYDENYNYTLLDKTAFDVRYLNALYDNSQIRKFIRVYFLENNKHQYFDYNNSDLVKYNVVEINAEGACFDAEYEYIKYYFIEGIGYFKKWISIIDNYGETIDNNLIRNMFNEYDKNFK